jgi:membrane-associated phospholipid phosphatase
MPLSAAHPSSGTFSLLRACKQYRFVDFATQGYLVIVGLLILLFRNERVSMWPYLLAGHAAAICAIHGLIRLHAARADNRILAFLRFFYPLLLYTAFYRESEALNLMFFEGYLDRVFLQLEERLFGFQPSVTFMATLPYIAVSEFFYASYFSYYVMIIGVGLALYFQNRQGFLHYISILSFVFYVCYLTYIFLPVIGPLALLEEIPKFPEQQSLPFYPLEYPAAIQAGLFFRIMKGIYAVFEGYGAAFPSSHVAVAICTLYFSWRYLPRYRHVNLAAVIGLSLATVYCRYHYAVDVLAGVITAAILLPLGELLYRRLESGRNRSAEQ